MVDFADRWDLQNRRALLKNLFQGLTLGRAAATADPLCGMVNYFEGDALGLPGGFIAVDAYPVHYWDPAVEEVPENLVLMDGIGWIGVRAAHRSEAIPADAGPDPEPITVEYTTGTRLLHPTVVRTWKADEVARCRRCHRCRAYASPDSPEVATCIVRHDGPIPETSPTPEPMPKPRPSLTSSPAEEKFQRRLAGIRRRNAFRASRECRKARSLEPAALVEV